MTDLEKVAAETDCRFMQAALAQARQAFELGEIPVGAVVVCDGRIIGRGHNLTEQLSDVTAHAEMLALTAAAQTLGGKYLPQATLYVTVEPCMMCAGAIGWAQVGRVVYGASDPRRGYRTLTAGAAASPLHPRTLVTAGVMAEESAELMKRFFAERRR